MKKVGLSILAFGMSLIWLTFVTLESGTLVGFLIVVILAFVLGVGWVFALLISVDWFDLRENADRGAGPKQTVSSEEIKTEG